MMPENRTQFTDGSVEHTIASRASENRFADCQAMTALLGPITGEPPLMWGPSIVGFGRYRTTYASGHSGEAPRVGFAFRGRELVVYFDVDDDAQKASLSRLGKQRMGKACLVVKQLAGLDIAVFEQLVRGSCEAVRRRYG